MIQTSILAPNCLIKAANNQLSSEIAGEAVILDLKSGVYYGLNETGNKIWQWLQEPKQVQEVCNLLLQEYEVETDQCSCDLHNILQEMLAAGLIEVVDEKAA